MEVKTLPKHLQDASKNGIEKYPIVLGKLTHLRRLNLSDNKLTEIPAEIGELTELEWLILGGNPIETLPESIGNLKKLEVLHLSHTPTLRTLQELSRHDTASGVLDAAARRDIEPITPEVRREGRVVTITLPGDPDWRYEEAR